MRVTVSQFAQSEGISEVEAGAILKHLAKRGFARTSTAKPVGRGRPATIYTFKKVDRLDMTKTVSDTAAPAEA